MIALGTLGMKLLCVPLRPSFSTCALKISTKRDELNSHRDGLYVSRLNLKGKDASVFWFLLPQLAVGMIAACALYRDKLDPSVQTHELLWGMFL